MEFRGVGGYHGIIRLAEDDFDATVNRHQHKVLNGSSNWFTPLHFLRWCATFALLTIGWILFRVNDITDFIFIISHLFEGILNPLMYIKNGLVQLGLGGRTLYEQIIVILCFVLGEKVLENKTKVKAFLHPDKRVKWIIYISIVVFIIFMIPVSGNKNFIYFQF